MLRQAVEKCPEELWADTSYVNPFWRVAYHALIYTHFYLCPSEADFVAWEKHKEGMQQLGAFRTGVGAIQPGRDPGLPGDLSGTGGTAGGRDGPGSRIGFLLAAV